METDEKVYNCPAKPGLPAALVQRAPLQGRQPAGTAANGQRPASGAQIAGVLPARLAVLSLLLEDRLLPRSFAASSLQRYTQGSASGACNAAGTADRLSAGTRKSGLTS